VRKRVRAVREGGAAAESLCPTSGSGLTWLVVSGIGVPNTKRQRCERHYNPNRSLQERRHRKSGHSAREALLVCGAGGGGRETPPGGGGGHNPL